MSTTPDYVNGWAIQYDRHVCTAETLSSPYFRSAKLTWRTEMNETLVVP